MSTDVMCAGDNAEDINRGLSPLGIRVQRFLLHTLLAVGMMDDRWQETVGRIVLGGGARKVNNAPLAMETIRVRIAADWTALRDKSQLMDGDLSFAIHRCFHKSPHQNQQLGEYCRPFADPAEFKTTSGRSSYESSFATMHLNQIFSSVGPQLAATIAAQKAELGQ